jgi:3-deoxy-7-phosphoheptulonate synthase
MNPDTDQGQNKMYAKKMRTTSNQANLYTPTLQRAVPRLCTTTQSRKAETMVRDISHIKAPYKLASRELQPLDTVVNIGGVCIGGGTFAIMAGPCSVESEDSFEQTIQAVKDAGAQIARGGAFKPRTSPYSFQGLAHEGLAIMQRVSLRHDIPTVTEIVDTAHLDAIYDHVDAFQVGARNMQNFELLKALGQSDKPVLLKRGMSSKLDELLMASEYILAGGNGQVVLCERGLRTFETSTRNTLDLNAVPYLKERTHLPVIVDPSHGTGIRSLVTPMARAAMACGADGVIVEVHHDPDNALSDGAQSLYPWQLEKLIAQLRLMAPVLGKEII